MTISGVDPELWPLLHLQGEMRVRFIKAGVDQKLSLDLAAEAMDAVAQSTCILPGLKAAYASYLRLSGEDERTDGDTK